MNIIEDSTVPKTTEFYNETIPALPLDTEESKTEKAGVDNLAPVGGNSSNIPLLEKAKAVAIEDSARLSSQGPMPTDNYSAEDFE